MTFLNGLHLALEKQLNGDVPPPRMGFQNSSSEAAASPLAA